MIDLRSDTVTRPTDAMREAAAEADVGDDVHRDDPTVKALEAKAAEILGTEAALYVPSGTMGNQVAALAHTRPGQEVILEAESHLYNWECGGLATNAGLQPRPLDGGETGLFSPDALVGAIIEESLHRAGTGLVAIEDTHNHAGGVAHAPAAIRDIAAATGDLPLHIDGARLWNAAVAQDVSPATLVEPADSVMVALSKGLGAPVGSIVAGRDAFIERARRERKRLGGGMRQAGIIAAPGLVALEHREHLATDHEHAARLAAAIDGAGGANVSDPETNIVLIDLAETSLSVDGFLEAAASRGVRATAFGPQLVRCCTHRDVSAADIDAAIDALTDILAG